VTSRLVSLRWQNNAWAVPPLPPRLGGLRGFVGLSLPPEAWGLNGSVGLSLPEAWGPRAGLLDKAGLLESTASGVSVSECTGQLHCQLPASDAASVLCIHGMSAACTLLRLYLLLASILLTGAHLSLMTGDWSDFVQSRGRSQSRSRTQ